MMIILYTKRYNLYEPYYFERYGFVYCGLQARAFYWEFLIHFRQILMIFVNLYFDSMAAVFKVIIIVF